MYLKVFVTPGAKREKVENRPAKSSEEVETLLISVREPAAQNRANDRVRAIVAEREGKPVQKVHILTGHRSRSKMISISS